MKVAAGERALLAASAPGKLMISGEYAVLDGAPAVVAAVFVRAYARWRAPGEDTRELATRLAPEAAAARELAEQAAGAVDAELAIDTSELRRSGRKLGLGSSAAAAAAAAGAVLASRGVDLATPSARRRVFELALAGHKAIAPEGSGADVAAAALGGFVRFRLEAGRLAEAEPTVFPATIQTRVVWTGKEARTSDFVRAVRAFEARDGAGFARRRDQLRAQAERFVSAIARDDAGEIVAAAGAYGAGMGELGRAAGVAIVTPELGEIARLAAEHGGSAKPSGAGGGDVAIAFFRQPAHAAAFDRACSAAALTPIELGLGAPGVRAEPVDPDFAARGAHNE